MEFLFWLNIAVLSVMTVIGILSFFKRLQRETPRSNDRTSINGLSSETA
jgi:hypothetical protein